MTTEFSADTTIQSIIIKMLGDASTSTDPNTRYKSQNLGTWSSTADVDNFLNECNHNTKYYGAALGSYVTIKDGTYNKEWVIAGFDCERYRGASDNSMYDNGYGICLIPKISLGDVVWDSRSTENGYYGSEINKITLPTVATNLQKVLGSHLILRKVLLSSAKAINSPNYFATASAYTWTTAYCTLMSSCQITGKLASNENKYDDGEANYILPFFKYKTPSFLGGWAWLRGISDRYANQGAYNSGTEGAGHSVCTAKRSLYPLIYIR